MLTPFQTSGFVAFSAAISYTASFRDTMKFAL